MTNDEELKKLLNNNTLERAFSYSRISDFDRNGPQALIKDLNISNYGMTIGSITDDLTIPKKGFKFEDKYIISDYSKPTSTLGKLVDIILDNYMEIPSKEEIINIINKNHFWSNIKDEEILFKRFDLDDFWEYLKVHIQRNTKNIISTEDYQKAKDLSEILKNHKYTKYIFSKNQDYINQYDIKFTYNDVILRGVIDRININHDLKTIQLIDLKTGKDSVLNFMNSFIKYRYYLQEAVYTSAFKSICKNLNLKKYKLLPFQIVYIGRNEKIPAVFNITNKWHKAAKKGFNIKGYKYRGLDSLIDDVKWHFNNNVFDITREIYEKDGFLNMEDNFITLNK